MKVDTVAATAIDIDISDTQNHLGIDREWLGRIAAEALRLQGIKSASVSLVLVDNATIERINRTHLEHDWPTDVITFPLSEPGELPLCAELFLSTEMAKETALAAGTEADAELALYLVHGLLHLCGLDDVGEADRMLMRREEQRVLGALGLPCLFDRPVAVDVEPSSGDAGQEEVAPCSE